LIRSAAAASSVTPAGRTLLFDRAGFPTRGGWVAGCALLALPWLPRSIGLAALVFSLLLFAFTLRSHRDLLIGSRDVGFLVSLALLCLAFGIGIRGAAPGWALLSPVACATLLVAWLYGRRPALAAGVALALAAAGGAADQTGLVFGLAGGVAAALGSGIRRRSGFYRPLLAIAAGNTAALAFLALARGTGAAGLSRLVPAGLGAALGSVAFAALALPVAEAVTRRATGLALLEWSDQTRPLLRRLATEAPGTWAHSLVVAQLCEAGCNAVGADGLLGRVGGYYHDVGKLMDPGLFAENQGGANPHAELTPRGSARAVRRHVEHGLELAARAGLPGAVSRLIPEHHGTARLDYFIAELPVAERIRAMDDPDFRYPGPRPRSREAGILMLADQAEAVVRVLDRAAPARVQEVVAHVIRARLEDGQLAEAGLSRAEVDRIQQVFVALLAALHHQRLDYPRSAGGVTKEFGRRPA
jgi:putative nucleotidyltransferase with HDIG domain